jgi:putative endonuclease
MLFMVVLDYCVYVLFCESDHQLYIGYTSNIEKRLEQHISGKNKSTKHRGPFRIIFLEYYLFKDDAMKRELYFKSTKGKRALKLMLGETLNKLKYKNIE